jgi:hypothetical protein
MQVVPHHFPIKENLSMVTTRKPSWKENDVFLIPLSDGTIAVGQVWRQKTHGIPAVACIFFDLRYRNATEFLITDLTQDRIISVLLVSSDSLKRKIWPVVGSNSPFDVETYLSWEKLVADDFIGHDITGSGNVTHFLDAFYSLRPWDSWFDPRYLDKKLIHPNKRPANVILTK